MNTTIIEPYGFIYITINIINGKKYIGQKRFDDKWRSYLGSGKNLQKAVKKYGKENFVKEIVAIAYTKDEIDNLEKEYIKNHQAVISEDYYNLSDGGRGGNENKWNKKVVTKDTDKFDNGDYNMVYKDSNIIMNIVKMKLEVNEKLVYYILRDFICYPSNSILINNEVPTMEDLESIIGLKERTIRKALKGLEEKGLVKLKSLSVRKHIFFNPFYYASGINLDTTTLEMFELLNKN